MKIRDIIISKISEANQLIQYQEYMSRQSFITEKTGSARAIMSNRVQQVYLNNSKTSVTITYNANLLPIISNEGQLFFINCTDGSLDAFISGY